MTFKVAIPTDLIKEGREYFIIRIHNGLAEKLDTTLNEDGTLSFSTDKFSTYALAYADPVSYTHLDVYKRQVWCCTEEPCVRREKPIVNGVVWQIFANMPLLRKNQNNGWILKRDML